MMAPSKMNNLVSMSTLLTLVSSRFFTEAMVFNHRAASRLTQHPHLQSFVRAQTNTLLDLKLDIHQSPSDPMSTTASAATPAASAHLPINNLQLELHCQQPISPSFTINTAPNNNPTTTTTTTAPITIRMPGIDGPLSELSSGVFGMDIPQPGQYITMEGLQHLDIIHAAWEMCWGHDHTSHTTVPSGSIILCLTLGKDAQRGGTLSGTKTANNNDNNNNDNGITIPKHSSLYITFHVFTPDGLQELQDDKERLLQKAKEYSQQRHTALAKMKATNNPIQKAIHYREALSAMELYSFIDFDKLRAVPSLKTKKSTPWDETESSNNNNNNNNSGDVLPIDGDLFISKAGNIWMMSPESHNNWKNNVKGQGRIHMGTATIVKTSMNDNDNDVEKNRSSSARSNNDGRNGGTINNKLAP